MQFLKENKWFVTLLVIALLLSFFCGRETNKKIKINNRISENKENNGKFKYTSCQIKEIDRLFSTLHKSNLFNGNVLIGQKDSIQYFRSFGYANRQKKDTLDEHSVFQLASVSKQFTAIAILQLYERGLLDLNDTIQKFIPEFPYKNISIHQLLTHRSGLPNYHYFFQHISTNCDTLITNNQLIEEMISKQPEAYYAPNKRYHYSNTGYAILATIVEQVAKCSFSNYLKKYIFSPLKMEDSYTFLSEKIKTDANLTAGYLSHRKEAENNYLDGVLGDKGVYCSIIDLFTWDQGLYKNKILADSVLQIAFQPMGKPKHFHNNYGYGWRMFNYGDSLKILFHAGWWHGYKSLLIRIPKDSISIIVLKNESNGRQISTKKLLKILYPLEDSSLVRDIDLEKDLN